MLLSYLSTYAVAMLLAVGEAGIHRLPINRTTFGWYWYDLVVPHGQGPLDQIAPTLQSRYPPPMGNYKAFLRSMSRKTRLQSLMEYGEYTEHVFKNDDNDDDDVYAWFFSIHTTPLSVGNPPLKLTAVVDTSWSTLFIPSANCTYYEDESLCTKHPLYNSSLSSTYRADLRPASLEYTGSLSMYTYGNISQDSIYLAAMEIKGQIFQEATSWEPDSGSPADYFDTVLGLALFPTRTEDFYFAASSPLQTMMKLGLLDNNIVSLKFGRTDEEIGELVLGDLPRDVSREDLIEIPLDHGKASPADSDDDMWRYYSMNGWQVSVQNMSVGSKGSGNAIPVLEIPQIAVIASSYPWIGLPTNVANRIHEAIGIENTFLGIDCDTRSQYPNWTIAFGPEGKTITLTPWDYLMTVNDKRYKKLRCVSVFYPIGDWMCEERGYLILGAPFLNGFYSVFDADRKTISFGNRPMEEIQST